MLELYDGLTLYHGSYSVVREIDLSKCNEGLDFGRGFYVTTSFEQAVSFVPKSVKRNIRTKKIPADFDVNDGQISVYRLKLDPALLTMIFQDANIDWVHYVAANRNQNLFPELFKALKNYDIIGGKIADDDTARTLNAYITGLFGIPGDEETDRTVIRRLEPDKLENQFCFRTDAAIGTLEFNRSVRYGDIKE